MDDKELEAFAMKMDKLFAMKMDKLVESVATDSGTRSVDLVPGDLWKNPPTVADGHWTGGLPARTWRFDGHKWVSADIPEKPAGRKTLWELGMDPDHPLRERLKDLTKNADKYIFTSNEVLTIDLIPPGFDYHWERELMPLSGMPDQFQYRHTLTRSEGEPVYEKFTDRARKVMQLANQEAQRFGCEFVGVQHVLLALVKEGSGVAANALIPSLVPIAVHLSPNGRQQEALRAVRLKVEELSPTRYGGQDEVVLGKLPHSDGTKDLVERSIAAARRLNHAYVGTEHILLGLLAQDADSPANRVLTALQVKAVALEREVMLLLGDDGGKLAKAATEAGIPLPGSVYTHGDVDPVKWIAAADKTDEDPSDDGYLDYGGDDTKGESLHPAFMPAASVLHRVRGRTYTDESLRLAVDAAVSLMGYFHGDKLSKPSGKVTASMTAADAFLEDLFGGPADEKAR